VKHARLAVTFVIIGSFFGIVFAFTQQARYSYPAAEPTTMCKTVQNVEQALVSLTVDKGKAISIAKSSVEFEKNTAGYKVENTEVQVPFSFNVFSCSFPRIENVFVGFLLSNGTESHVLMLQEDPSLGGVDTMEQVPVGQYGFFKQ